MSRPRPLHAAKENPVSAGFAVLISVLATVLFVLELDTRDQVEKVDHKVKEEVTPLTRKLNAEILRLHAKVSRLEAKLEPGPLLIGRPMTGGSDMRPSEPENPPAAPTPPGGGSTPGSGPEDEPAVPSEPRPPPDTTPDTGPDNPGPTNPGGGSSPPDEPPPPGDTGPDTEPALPELPLVPPLLEPLEPALCSTLPVACR